MGIAYRIAYRISHYRLHYWPTDGSPHRVASVHRYDRKIQSEGNGKETQDLRVGGKVEL